MSENLENVPSLNLTCPYCGGDLRVIMDFEGVDYTPTKEVDSFECLEFRCGAEWDAGGVILRRSDLSLNPAPNRSSRLEFPKDFNKDV
jgi:hypothetical protein